MKNLIYCFGFMVSLTIILVGLNKTDGSIIQSGTSLLFFMLMAFVGSTISEIKNKKIDRYILKFIIPLFIISIGSIIYGACTNHIVIASLISLLLGLISISLIFKKRVIDN